MKLFLFGIVVIGLLSFQTVSAGCGVNINYTLYNLCPFSGKTFPIVTLYHDMTLSLATPAVSNCDKNNATNIYALSKLAGTDDNGIGTCTVLADADPVNYTFLDPSAPSKGISITFPMTSDSIQDYKLVVNLKCNADATTVEDTAFEVDNDFLFVKGTNTITISGESSLGCPAVSFNKAIDFIGTHAVIFTIVFFILGILIAFFGLKLFNFVIFTLTVIIITSAAFTFLMGLTGDDVGTGLTWTLFIISLILALIAGYFSLKHPNIGYFLIGAVLGIIAGLLLFASIVSPFVTSDNGTAILAVTLIITTILGGIAGIYLIEGIIILATSAIGAYISIRAISFVLGGFPLESEIANGDKAFSGIAYLYIALMILVAASGVFFQFKMKKKAEEQEEAFNK